MEKMGSEPSEISEMNNKSKIYIITSSAKSALMSISA